MKNEQTLDDMIRLVNTAFPNKMTTHTTINDFKSIVVEYDFRKNILRESPDTIMARYINDERVAQYNALKKLLQRTNLVTYNIADDTVHPELKNTITSFTFIFDDIMVDITSTVTNGKVDWSQDNMVVTENEPPFVHVH